MICIMFPVLVLLVLNIFRCVMCYSFAYCVNWYIFTFFCVSLLFVAIRFFYFLFFLNINFLYVSKIKALTCFFRQFLVIDQNFENCLNDWKILVNLVKRTKNIDEWIMLRQVLAQVWDKWLKCLGDQNVSAKITKTCLKEKVLTDITILL